MKRNPVAWAALVVSTAALVNSSGVLRPMPAAPKLPPKSQEVAQALSQAYEAVAEFVKPSAVQISVQKKAAAGPDMRNFRFPMPGNPRNGPQTPNDMKDLEEMLKKFFGPEGRVRPNQFGGRGGGVGSGFVYDDKGHILTNYHVVEGAEKIVVAFSDGVELPATVVGTDDKSDVAVIKVESTNYPPLPRGNSSSVKVGDLVMAVGSPFELSQSVTTGIISATERNNVRINEYESFIQTDAAINPGNSGGPLVNMAGEVVGVNSAIVTGSRGNDGIGFAIPIDMAAEVADQLIASGKVQRSRIGIQLAPLTPILAKQLGVEDAKGVLAEQVLPGSPAEKAGLKPGDVIVGFGGEKVDSVPIFRLKVASSKAGQEFPIEYFREGKRQQGTIVPAPSEEVVFNIERERKEAEEEGSTAKESEKSPIADFGIDVQPLTPELAESLGIPKDVNGLLVASVKEGSPAEAEQIREGDVITKVVRDKSVQPVGDVKSFQELAASVDTLSIYVQSGQGPGRFVSLAKPTK